MVSDNKKNKFLSFLPICTASIITFGFNLICYYVPKIIVPESRYIHYLSSIDKVIPFCPIFIIFYILSYVQWANYYLRAAVSDRKVKFTYFSAEILCKIISLFCFIFLPLTIDRPQFEVTDIFTFLTSLIYEFDTPFCLLPSIHCIQSYLSLRLCIQLNNRKQRWLSVIMTVFTLCVFMSTVFVKQHLFCDVITGVLLPELCLQIVKRTQLPGSYEKFVDNINKLIFEN